MCATANMPIMHQCTVTGACHSDQLFPLSVYVLQLNVLDSLCFGLGVERGGEEDRLSILDVGLSN